MVTDPPLSVQLKRRAGPQQIAPARAAQIFPDRRPPAPASGGRAVQTVRLQRKRHALGLLPAPRWPGQVAMGERLDLQVARAWLLLSSYENDRSDAIAANVQYDLAGLLVRGPDDPVGAPGQAARPHACGQEPHAGLPPSRVPGYAEVVNRGMANPGSWVFLADVNRHADTAPVMRFVYWDDESDTWRRFAACPDCFQPFTVRQPWRSLAASGPGQGSGPGPSSGPGAYTGSSCCYAPNLECLQAIGRRSS